MVLRTNDQYILLGTITRIVRLLVSGFEGINTVWWVAVGVARRRLWANAPGGFTQTPVGSCEISMRCACCDWKTRGASERTYKINPWTWKQGAFKWSARSRAQRECHMVCHQTETFYLLNTLVNWFIKHYQFLLDRLCEKNPCVVFQTIWICKETISILFFSWFTYIYVFCIRASS